MFDTHSFGDGDFIRNDIHAGVYLHGISVDDPCALPSMSICFLSKFKSEFDGEFGLSDTSSSTDRDQWFEASHFEATAETRYELFELSFYLAHFIICWHCEQYIIILVDAGRNGLKERGVYLIVFQVVASRCILR